MSENRDDSRISKEEEIPATAETPPSLVSETRTDDFVPEPENVVDKDDTPEKSQEAIAEHSNTSKPATADDLNIIQNLEVKELSESGKSPPESLRKGSSKRPSTLNLAAGGSQQGKTNPAILISPVERQISELNIESQPQGEGLLSCPKLRDILNSPSVASSQSTELSTSPKSPKKKTPARETPPSQVSETRTDNILPESENVVDKDDTSSKSQEAIAEHSNTSKPATADDRNIIKNLEVKELAESGKNPPERLRKGSSKKPSTLNLAASGTQQGKTNPAILISPVKRKISELNIESQHQDEGLLSCPKLRSILNSPSVASSQSTELSTSPKSPKKKTPARETPPSQVSETRTDNILPESENVVDKDDTYSKSQEAIAEHSNTSKSATADDRNIIKNLEVKQLAESGKNPPERLRKGSSKRPSTLNLAAGGTQQGRTNPAILISPVKRKISELNIESQPQGRGLLSCPELRSILNSPCVASSESTESSTPPKSPKKKIRVQAENAKECSVSSNIGSRDSTPLSSPLKPGNPNVVVSDAKQELQKETFTSPMKRKISELGLEFKPESKKLDTSPVQNVIAGSPSEESGEGIRLPTLPESPTKKFHVHDKDSQECSSSSKEASKDSVFNMPAVPTKRCKSRSPSRTKSVIVENPQAASKSPENLKSVEDQRLARFEERLKKALTAFKYQRILKRMLDDSNLPVVGSGTAQQRAGGSGTPQQREEEPGMPQHLAGSRRMSKHRTKSSTAATERRSEISSPCGQQRSRSLSRLENVKNELERFYRLIEICYERAQEADVQRVNVADRQSAPGSSGESSKIISSNKGSQDSTPLSSPLMPGNQSLVAKQIKKKKAKLQGENVADRQSAPGSSGESSKMSSNKGSRDSTPLSSPLMPGTQSLVASGAKQKKKKKAKLQGENVADRQSAPGSSGESSKMSSNKGSQDSTPLSSPLMPGTQSLVASGAKQNKKKETFASPMKRKISEQSLEFEPESRKLDISKAGIASLQQTPSQKSSDFSGAEGKSEKICRVQTSSSSSTADTPTITAVPEDPREGTSDSETEEESHSKKSPQKRDKV